MTGIVFACVAPHGFPIIPDLSDNAEGALVTRAAMHDLGRRVAAAQPDVIVIATPHGIRVEHTICLAAAARAAGTLHWEDRQVEMHVPLDAALTDTISTVAQAQGVPIARAAFAGNRREQSVVPMDWAVLTPLWFMGYGRNMRGHGDVLAEPPTDSGPTVVIATPSRLLPRTQMVQFGRAVAEAAAQDGRRIVFVASCDWGHTHKASGPYGYHPAAAAVDTLVVQALRDNDPARLIDLPDEDAQHAAIDGLWQTLMLAGVMQHTPMRGEVLCYEAPSYYG